MAKGAGADEALAGRPKAGPGRRHQVAALQDRRKDVPRRLAGSSTALDSMPRFLWVVANEKHIVVWRKV